MNNDKMKVNELMKRQKLKQSFPFLIVCWGGGWSCHRSMAVTGCDTKFSKFDETIQPNMKPREKTRRT